MSLLVGLVFLSSWSALASTFPHNTFDKLLKRSRAEVESSGSGLDEPVRGIVRVVQLDRHALAQSGFFRGGPVPRRTPSLGPRLPFPAFLSQGRPGPAPASKAPVSPLHHLRHKSPAETELKKRHGLQMWQRAVDKGDKLSLPVNLKDTKQTCAAIPFTQRVTADGCDAVTVHNKLCFGQCSSLFVPSEGEFTGAGAPRRRAPCSRCAPSKAQTVTVPLRCGAEVRRMRVMVVEECKCETGSEERSVDDAAAAAVHMQQL